MSAADNPQADLPSVLRDQAFVASAATARGGTGRRQWLIGGAIALLAVVALCFPMETVVVSPGRVIPSDRVKSIQHLEGGIVSAVYVKEGETVRQGQSLV